MRRTTGNPLEAGHAVDRAEVRHERQEHEEARHDVAPLRDPRDRFDAERMEPEDERGGRRGAEGGVAQEPPGHQEDERRVERVQEDARQVIAARVHPPEGVIEGKREPRQRDVMAHQCRGEHPAEVRRREAAEVRVVGEVHVVVPVDEAVAQRGGERGEDDEGDEERDDPGRPPALPRPGAGRSGHRSRRRRRRGDGRAVTARHACRSRLAKPSTACAGTARARRLAITARPGAGAGRAGGARALSDGRRRADGTRPATAARAARPAV